MTSENPNPWLAAHQRSTLPNPQPTDSVADPFQTTVEPPSRPGITRLSALDVPGYEILEEIGRGGMGVVYRARHLRLRRFVALKMILPGALSERTRHRFQVEAEAIARLNHPGIIQIYEVGQVGDRPYLALELAEGGSLHNRTQGRPQDPASAAGLVRVLADALSHAHQNAIVHRDLKPSNILLQSRSPRLQEPRSSPETSQSHTETIPDACLPGLLESWTPKITDFGLAKLLDASGGQTRPGDLIGTPQYMAPEQAEGSVNAVGPWTDVYALGAILYECLTGKPPFDGTNPLLILYKVANEPPVPPRRLQPGVPRDLETICLKCLEKDRQQRYHDAGEVADELGRFLRGEPILTRPAGRLDRLFKWGRQRPRLVGAVALALATCLAVFAWHYIAVTQLLEQRTRQVAAQTRRADGERILARARQAATAGDWKAVESRAAAALNKLEQDEPEGDLTREARALLNQARQGIAARERLARFQALRSQSLFALTRFSGRDRAEDAAELADRVSGALRAVGFDPDGSGPLHLEPAFYSEAERQLIRAGCYEGLLILAEVRADHPSRNGPGPLVLLDRAAGLGVQTRAWHLRRARYLRQAGDAEAATREVTRAPARPTLAVDHFLLGEDCRRRDPARAAAHFEDALRADPGHTWARYLQAVCHLRLGRPGEARVGLNACLGGPFDSPWGFVLRALASAQLGDFSRAEEDLAQALKLRPDPWALYGVLVNRGSLRLRQGRLAEAESDFREAVRLRPGQWQAWLNLGQTLERQGRLEEAAAALGDAIQARPNDALLRAERGRVHSLRGDWRQALADLERLPRTWEDSRSTLAEYWYQKARVEERLDRLGPALRSCEAALELWPGMLAARYFQGQLLTALERPAEAEAALTRYLNDGGRRRAEALRQRGQARVLRGDIIAARNDFSAAAEVLEAELQPVELGAVAAALGREPLACLACSGHAQQARRKLAEIYALRGWQELAAGSVSLAEADFERAFAVTGDPDVRAGRGLTRVLRGAWREGLDDVQAALREGTPGLERLYASARAHAAACSVLQLDRKLSSAEKEKIYATCEREAYRLLGKTLESTPPSKRERLLERLSTKDPLWRPFQNRPWFKELLARFRPSQL